MGSPGEVENLEDPEEAEANWKALDTPAARLEALELSEYPEEPLHVLMMNGEGRGLWVISG